MGVLSRIAVAVAVFIIAGVVMVYLLGPFLIALGLPYLPILGEFFIRFGWLLALAIAILVFFGGVNWNWPAMFHRRP